MSEPARTLTDADVEAIARRLAELVPANRQNEPRPEPKPRRKTKAEISAQVEARLRRAGIR